MVSTNASPQGDFARQHIKDLTQFLRGNGTGGKPTPDKTDNDGKTLRSLLEALKITIDKFLEG